MPLSSLFRAFSVAFIVWMAAVACQNAHSETPGWTGFKPAQSLKYQGTYTGSYDKGFITLVINYISGRIVSGYNIHKGLRRNVNGELSLQQDGKLGFVLKEPGDNRYDGIFSFTMDTATMSIQGKWSPLDSNGMKKLISKNFLLARQQDLLSEEVMDWSAQGDSVLEFHPDGTCEFQFYQNPADSTSQQITVRGNYVHRVDTFRIEWEKNKYTPAQTMKMVIHRPKSEQDENQDYTLKGHGWIFTPLGD